MSNVALLPFIVRELYLVVHLVLYGRFDLSVDSDHFIFVAGCVVGKAKQYRISYCFAKFTFVLFVKFAYFVREVCSTTAVTSL